MGPAWNRARDLVGFDIDRVSRLRLPPPSVGSDVGGLLIEVRGHRHCQLSARSVWRASSLVTLASTADMRDAGRKAGNWTEGESSVTSAGGCRSDGESTA